MPSIKESNVVTRGIGEKRGDPVPINVKERCFRPGMQRFGADLAGVRNDAGGCRWRPVSTIGDGINDEVDILGTRPNPRAANMLEPHRSAGDSTMAATVPMRNVPRQKVVMDEF